jgi:hypothetical protein
MYARRLKLRYNGGNLQFTVPRDLVRQLKLAPGIEFDLVCDEQKLVIDLTTMERSKVFDYSPKALEPEVA